jgi:hypothetical protein
MIRTRSIAVSLAALAVAAQALSGCDAGGNGRYEAPCTSGELRQLLEGCGTCSAGIAREQCNNFGIWEPAGCFNAIDADGDGFPNRNCTSLPGGCCTTERDCIDDDAEAYPGAAERCNGVDDDCDGETDEDCP